ncbi:hypothetical protein ACOMHN_034740 [Nucella lapillus]
MDRVKEEMGIKGFTVQFSQNTVNIPKPGGVLVFDRALSNVDHCYSSSTGAFTAPKTGVYAFYVSGLLSTDDNEGYTDLVLEKTSGHPLQKIFLRSRGDIFVGSQGSFDVRVKLERGDQVHLRHVRGDLGLKGQSFTTFSGVLECEYADSVVLPSS